MPVDHKSVILAVASENSPSLQEGDITFLSVGLDGTLRTSAGTTNVTAASSFTNDGATNRLARVFDADTGGGVEYVAGAILRKSAGGGSVEIGTLSNPLRIDVTDLTAQTVRHGKTIKSATGSISATTTVIAAVPQKRIKVTFIGLRTASTTPVTATFKDGAGGTDLWTEPLQAISGTVFGTNESKTAPDYFFGTTAGGALELALSTGQSVVYNISYFDDDAS